MRLLLGAITSEKGDLQGNLRRHVDLLAEAYASQVDLVVLPEMSLTGSVDPTAHPERLITLDDHAVLELVAATWRTPVMVLFGVAERDDGSAWITQVLAGQGRVLGVQRKRHLGEDERGFSTAPLSETASIELGGTRVGVVICAESTLDAPWDASTAGGESLVCFVAAPGLTGRRADPDQWRDGLRWWESAGLADAQRAARRLGVWVAMATQAGSTADEDFPGVAALIDPSGTVVERLPDERPGTLVVEAPVGFHAEAPRQAVRVLTVDGTGRTLLACFGDEARGLLVWVPPGGGREAGEDDLMAARRELLEELGRDDLAIGPSIGRRRGTVRSAGGTWFSQSERWYLCRCDPFEIPAPQVAAGRAEGILDLRWWTAAELREQAVVTGPRRLADLVDRVLAGEVLDPEGTLPL